MNVRPLETTDLAGARALLTDSDLPTDDLDDASISLFGAFDGDKLVGVIGLQTCESVGLLRSLAVAPACRNAGIAGVLCRRLFEVAAERSMTSLWLLTTSATDYFTRHGFEVVPRDAVPDAIRATAQFSALCPSTARVMHRR
jgi:amino-acid N-acetyltransferase